MTNQTQYVNANIYDLFDLTCCHVFQCSVILMKTSLLLELLQ